MFESRSIASLSQSEISMLLQAAISCQQKSNSEKKRRANPVYEKEKTNRKWQGSWKWAASGEERLWLTNNEVNSGICNHRMSLNAQPSSWRELRTTKDLLCINTASRLRRQRRTHSKLMEPDLRSRLRNNRLRISWVRVTKQMTAEVLKKNQKRTKG